MIQRMLVAAAAAAALTACASNGMAPRTPDGTPMSALAAPTMAMPYLMKAGASDLYEIQSSRIALETSQNADVRRYAQMMIDHHTQTTAQATAAARAAGLTPPPPMLEPHQQAMVAELQAAPAGAAFDGLYVRQQVMAHQGALAVNRTYSMQGDTPQLRETAAATVPIVQSHLTEVERMAAAMPPM